MRIDPIGGTGNGRHFEQQRPVRELLPVDRGATSERLARPGGHRVAHHITKALIDDFLFK